MQIDAKTDKSPLTTPPDLLSTPRSKRRLKIGILDLVHKGPTRALWARLMHANLASIMPQALAVWCEEAGHDVTFAVYTGLEDVETMLPDDVDMVFIGAFTQAAQLSYALSNLYRQRGAVTVLGGPHARCYPEDAARYFDYVCGFTDRDTLDQILAEAAPHRPMGVCLAARKQPTILPTLEQRWKYVAPTLKKTPAPIKMVPMLGSLGCPYTCSFCIDSEIEYQPFEFARVGEDLKFLVKTMPGSWVAWHDPNFGVRFDEMLNAIEEAVPKGKLSFAAESSLSLLSEPRLKRLHSAGFVAMLPGVESWFSLGNKSKTGARQGREKVEQVSDHINMIMRYIPYVQANFVLGLDVDAGDEPFELTKQFLRRTPGVFPGYSLMSAFGEAAPLNLDLQRAGRVLPFPFHFLNNNEAMNVKPKNYEWVEFYDRIIDLVGYSFSAPTMARRVRANLGSFAWWGNIVRGISSEGYGRLHYHSKIRGLLKTDATMRDFFEGATDVIPEFYRGRVREELGPLWSHLPEGALDHDPTAYLKKTEAQCAKAVRVRAAGRAATTAVAAVTPDELAARPVA
jgi:hypothetical protein